jgi:hypothetical protein
MQKNSLAKASNNAENNCVTRGDSENIITQQYSRAPDETKKSHKNITFTASMTILTFHIEKY